MNSSFAEGLRLLRRLEIPDCCNCPPENKKPIPCACTEPCDCPVHLPPPCPHVLARDHALSLAEWGELLLLIDPDEYTEPPRPDAPAIALRRAARVATYHERLEEGRHLYHGLDLWRSQPTDDRVKAGRGTHRLSNGYDDPDEDLAVAGRIGPEEEPPGLVDELWAEATDTVPLRRRFLLELMRCRVGNATERRAA